MVRPFQTPLRADSSPPPRGAHGSLPCKPRREGGPQRAAVPPRKGLSPWPAGGHLLAVCWHWSFLRVCQWGETDRQTDRDRDRERETERALPRASSEKDPNPITGPTLLTLPIHLPRPLIQIPSHCGERASTCESGGMQTFSPQQGEALLGTYSVPSMVLAALCPLTYWSSHTPKDTDRCPPTHQEVKICEGVEI